MALPLNTFEKLKTRLFKYSDDPGKMLLHTATVGWVISALAQVWGIVNDKRISKKEKQFLIPQEVADAAVNIASFYIVTDSLQKISQRLVAKGKIITPAIRKVCQEHGIQFAKDADGKPVNIGEAIKDKIAHYKDIIVSNDAKALDLKLNENKIAEITKKIDELKNFNDKKYSPFENGFKIAGNVVGGVISGNIITPMLRNPIAAYKQQSAINREQLEKDAASYRAGKTLPVQNQIYVNEYKSKVANARQNSGSMKV